MGVWKHHFFRHVEHGKDFMGSVWGSFYDNYFHLWFILAAMWWIQIGVTGCPLKAIYSTTFTNCSSSLGCRKTLVLVSAVQIHNIIILYQSLFYPRWYTYNLKEIVNSELIPTWNQLYNNVLIKTHILHVDLNSDLTARKYLHLKGLELKSFSRGI